MKRENLLWGGVLGPVVYVIAVVLGGIFTPGYSHLRQAVSELIEAGAVHKLWLDPLFIVYNLGVLAFGQGLLAMIKAQSSNQSRRFGTWGGWMLVIISALGVLMTLFFPMDPVGTVATLPGTIHLVLAGLISLFTMLAILFAGLWFRSFPSLHVYASYAFVTMALVFLSGLGAVAVMAAGLPLLGLLERVTIGAFLQWVFVMAFLIAPRAATARRAPRGQGDYTST